MHFTHARVIVY